MPPSRRDLLAARFRQLLDEDLDRGRERNCDERSGNAEQGAEERDGDDDEECGQVDGLALNLRGEDVVLELLVGKHRRA